MGAYLTGENHLDYSIAAPVLIAGSTEQAIRNAERIVEAAGLRVADAVPIEAAVERIVLQASASAVWLEVDRDGGPALDALLDRINRDAAAGRYAAVVSAGSEFLDPVLARLVEPSIEILIDGGEAERVAALAVAIGNSSRAMRLSDVAADKNAARIRQLSEEVGRIASTLARLSEGPAAQTHRPVPFADKDAPEVSAEAVRAVIRARRLRSRYFPEELFADPAWDMLLDLLQAEISHLRVPVSSLCIAAAVPATTALRWLKTMVSQGIFIRRADPHDGRRVFVELAPETSQALRRYFAEVEPAGVI
jgi:hypothetical protein